ncbi:amastin-like protein [Leishmania major strain Friedlin]|uniref:Amastin-like protein n=1 Tax=Leishmania major TaxID=5664 RepID=Q4QI87_LEIMA|nr:amastin-like protein [Leishmania major strain Friedlin]CAG9569381.1 amastin-like_protein [Leishmania major strain Friedlin]CAJ02261.1 amastin-like protein [Leishmania major strain Friedlin]|eukprot:XP_001681111.1 amastin-like protein [Leishmania major strain Friedlin]
MACRIGMLLYVISQFLAFLFVLVGTPIDMFRVKGLGRFANTPCLTLWGGKEECYSTKYDVSYDELWANCNDRLLQFRVAEALAVISIFVYGLAFILGFIALFCCLCFRWVCLTLNILGIGTLGVVWALMVVVYYKDDGLLCPRVSSRFDFGFGFILLLVAWSLNIINIVLLLLPCPLVDSGTPKTRPQNPTEQ